MGGSCPESCITDPRNTRLEETSWEQRGMEAPFEGCKLHTWMDAYKCLAETMEKSRHDSVRFINFWTEIRTLGVLYTAQ
jgi:hypothetical protein